MYYATPEQALATISNGESIWSHSMAATPYSMLNALAKVALDKRDLTLLSLHTELSSALCDPALQGHLRQRVFFVGRPTRPAVNCGAADYVPAFLSEIPKMFRSGEQVIDTAIIQVSPPDKHGLCSLGVSVEATPGCAAVGEKNYRANQPQDAAHPWRLFCAFVGFSRLL